MSTFAIGDDGSSSTFPIGDDGSRAEVIVDGKVVGYASDFVPVSSYRIVAPSHPSERMSPDGPARNRAERRRRAAIDRKKRRP